jgi:2-polyprenyl-3-methyl-5-hydroxy-6-metoxy-1,4-benzoquinol methylase
MKTASWEMRTNPISTLDREHSARRANNGALGPKMKRIKVLYVAGYPRCGSTLFSRMLGTLPGFCAVGEAAAHFFRFSESVNSPCGCGLSVDACPFWREVGFSATMPSVHAQLFRFRKLPFLESCRSKYKEGTQQLLGSISSLYYTLAEKTSARVIVDSSKTPLHARLLSWIPEIDLSVVHLVRDPRGVVGSYRQPKGYLPKLSSLDVTAGWIGLTLGCEDLQGRVPQYRTLRYEDFAANPQRATAEIASDLGYEGNVAELFSGDSTVELNSQHMLGGNPDKLQRGPVQIKVRSAELPRAPRVLVSLVTAPFLWRYHYWSSKPNGSAALRDDGAGMAAGYQVSPMNQASPMNDAATLYPNDKPEGYFSCPRSELIPLVPSNAKRILEIGCAEGGFARALRLARPTSQLEIVGVELCETAAIEAATVLDRVIVGNVERMDLPYQDYFDCVMFADVLEHLVDPWRMLRRAKSLLRRGGVIVASIPNVQHLRVLLNLILGRWEYEQYGIMDSTHLRFFTRKSINTLFTSTGYELRSVSGILGSTRVKLLHFATAGLADPFVTRQYLIVADAKAADPFSPPLDCSPAA